MNLPSIQKLFLFVLVCIMFAPYVTSFLGLSTSSIYQAEIIALVSWYVASLTIPLIMEDLDTVFVLWYFTFILVGVATVTDMVYHTNPRAYAPAHWYSPSGNLSRTFESFIKEWVLFALPGCVLFSVMTFVRKVYFKSKDTAS
jgi:hypothetical protein